MDEINLIDIYIDKLIWTGLILKKSIQLIKKVKSITNPFINQLRAS